MLQSAGWEITQQEDITDEFLTSIKRMIVAEEEQHESLRLLRGDDANETARANWQARRQAVTDRLIFREFFSAVPA